MKDIEHKLGQALDEELGQSTSSYSHRWGLDEYQRVTNRDP